MRSDAADPYHNSGVLNAPIRIEELCPDRTNLWALGMLKHRSEPVGPQNFHIVVQEQQIFTMRLSRVVVANLSEINARN